MISNLRIFNIIKGDAKLKKNGDNKKKKIKKIRCGMMNGSDIQEMIDKLIDWYKVRFPNYCLTVNNGAVEIDKLYRENSNCVNMTFDEFINRMVFSFETSLKCYYAKDIEATELQKFTNIDSTKAIVVKLYTIKEKFLKRDIDKVCFIAADKKNGRIISILDDGILPNDIKNKSFKNAYLLCGEEEYLKLNYKNQLIKSIAGDDTMNLGMYEGKNIDINEVIDSAETVPFFAEYRLIVMENTGLFKSGGEQLAEYMKTIPSTTIFLFVESDVDKRSKMYKAVKSAGYICEINRQTENDIAIWAARIFDYNGKKITKANMSYLIASVGTDMEVLSREIEKLISYALNKNVISKEDIDAVCIKQLNVRIFDMMDAISVKNQKKTLDCYYELIAEKEPPMRILFMISRQFNLMLQAKDLSSRGMNREQVAHTMGVQSFIAGKCINQCRNFSMAELKSGLAESVNTESLIKSGMMDENIGVEMLLVKYSKRN